MDADYSYMIALFWLSNLATPALMVLCGVVLVTYSHRKFGCSFSYKLPRALKNAEAWAFAQKCFGRVNLTLGVLLLIATYRVYIINRQNLLENNNVLLIVLGVLLAQVIVFLLTIPYTEIRFSIKYGCQK